jgi:UDP:flavonoid glycosyltransferase YjiC (YdhE family)
VRVLFGCVAADGHFLPLVPLARAFMARGDDVAVATAASFAPRVEAEGLSVLPAGIDQAELERRFAPYRDEIRQLPVPERRKHAYTNRFGRLDAPARLDDLFVQARAWRPDLMVHESSELATPVVAEALGLPSVNHSFGRIIPRSAMEAATSVTAAMWTRSGLEPQPFNGSFRGAYVDLCPPSLAAEHPPPGTPVLPLRAIAAAKRDDVRDRPLVYVTLGTIMGSTAVFRLLLSALADVDADVLLTTGRNNDPSELAPVPANATVEQYVPQSEVLTAASVVVTHGGSGSMLGALAHGLPMLVVPQGADQFENGAAAAGIGAARVLMPDAVDEQSVRSAVVELLTDVSFRAAAESVAAEIAAMPSAAEVAERLSAL